MIQARAHVEGASPNLSPDPMMSDQLASSLTQFDAITLPQMEEVKLLDRVDTKFLMTEGQLLEILDAVRPYYTIMDAAGILASRYRTQYYDTNDFNLYLDHHNDRQNRYKVRSRAYVDAGISFMEIKRKTNKRRTAKVRCQISGIPDVLEGETLAFVREHYPGDAWALRAVIWNTFRRITLVSKYRRERLTIDVDLRYGWGERLGGLEGIAIAEVKQRKFSIDSDFVRELRRRHIQRTGFSKYCAGMSFVYPTLKANRFKRRDLLIARLLRKRGTL
jgi:hypothetical protein